VREETNMPSLHPYAEQDFYSKMRELKWSSTERAIARRAFDRVLRQELDAAIRSTKEMAAKITQPYELWELEEQLTELRKAQAISLITPVSPADDGL
jgi:hypothetical protein